LEVLCKRLTAGGVTHRPQLADFSNLRRIRRPMQIAECCCQLGFSLIWHGKLISP